MLLQQIALSFFIYMQQNNLLEMCLWWWSQGFSPTGISHDIKTAKRAYHAASCHSMPKKRVTGSSGSVYGLIQGGFGSAAHSSARSRCRTPALRPWLARMDIICLPFQSCVAQNRAAVWEGFFSFSPTSEAKCPHQHIAPIIQLYIWNT